ncbi:hypothetical protein PMAYCL1PPCAC_31696, partial [Pristionchus mayeri]
LAGLVIVYSAPMTAVDSSDVSAFLSQLALNDENRGKDGQVVVAYQNQASGKTFDHDNAPNPLFTSVDSALLAQPTYKSLISLVNLFDSQDADKADPETPDRHAASLGFIDDISTTKVFNDAWTYLHYVGIASSDYSEFRKQLYTLWFSVFARNQAVGSSGFKATFVGEYLNEKVVGLTNWIRFALLEQVNGVNYHGWFERQFDVQLSLQFGLELPVGEKQAMKSNLLLSTSPEFEFMAYSVCILSGNSACSLMIAGNKVILNVDTVTVSGNRVISVAYPSIGATSATTTKKPATKAPIDEELQTLVDNMRAQDDDKPSSSQYKLSWGDKLGSNPKPSGKDLISDVDESLFTKPVYADLKKVYDNGILNPDVCVNETDYNSGFKRSILQSLLDTWSTTKPFALMHDFLVQRGKLSADLTTFKQFLTTFWFGTYTRCTDDKAQIGSSGFEHVFSGEFKGDIIDGHHNWMKYYINQKAGDINYYGYYTNDDQLTGTFEYDWAERNKKTGGMLFGTSPAFDFSLFTACSMTHTGEAACRFMLDGYELAVTAYTQECAAGGLCLSTSYPEDNL